MLDLSHNKLVKLPSNIDQLRNLKQLNLSHNNISHLPASIYSLTKLTHFDMSFNPITRISANMARLHHLNYLDLSNTDISAIPAELLNLSMAIIKTDHCPQLLDRSVELEQRTAHNPLSLIEICARQIIQPILYDLMAKKKKKTRAERAAKAAIQELPAAAQPHDLLLVSAQSLFFLWRPLFPIICGAIPYCATTGRIVDPC